MMAWISGCQPAKSAAHSSFVPCSVQRVALPVVALDHADEVQQLTAPQRIGDDVAAGPVPVAADGTVQLFGQPLDGHDAAPGHQSRELRLGRVEQVRAQARVHAVGADHDVAGNAPAVLELEHDAIAPVGAGDAARAQVDGARLGALHRLPQHAMEIAAMHHPVGRAEALERIAAEVEQRPGLAGAPEPDLLGRRLRHHLAHGRAEAQRDQDARAIRSELDAGADFAQLVGLLEHLDVEAALQQRQRRGQAAEAGAGDQDARLVGHDYLRRAQ